jgi:SanA protein
MNSNKHESFWNSVCRRFRANRVRVVVGGLVALLLSVASVLWADYVCRSAAAGRIFRAVDQMPLNQVALVLGTGKTTRKGNPNLHFTQRINAAVELYRSGKVQHLLVSGDNHIASYDEPTDMVNALVAKGIPANAVTRDNAGFRTLDSVVRANSVFGLKKFTIVTEEFHCRRALWIAQQHGLDAAAFAAPDLSARWSLRVKAREALARVLCGLDLYVLNRRPHFPGPPEPLVLTAAGSAGQ